MIRININSIVDTIIKGVRMGVIIIKKINKIILISKIKKIILIRKNSKWQTSK